MHIYGLAKGEEATPECSISQSESVENEKTAPVLNTRQGYAVAIYVRDGNRSP